MHDSERTGRRGRRDTGGHGSGSTGGRPGSDNSGGDRRGIGSSGGGIGSAGARTGRGGLGNGGWLVCIAACVGIWLVRTGAEPPAPPQPSPAQAFTTGPGRPTEPAADPLPPSAPVRLRIPRIAVDTPLVGLGLASDGSLDVPPATDRNLAGWYRDGTPPGARGTALVAGHVDTARGPAVFYSLGTLGKGHRIEVTRRDGRTAVFSVDAVEVYEADAFPDRKVYGAAERAELRVITCGGGFSTRTGYRGNVVAYAHLVAARPASAPPGSPGRGARDHAVLH